MARVALLDLCIGMGVERLGKELKDELTALVGERYRHDEDRPGHWWGTTKSRVTLGGRQVTIERPRGRWIGGGEVTLPTLAAVAAEDPFQEHVLRLLLAGVSTRRYRGALEPLTQKELPESATSRSAVSRRFVARTAEQLQAFLARSLSSLKLVSVVVDGFALGDTCVILALGIDVGGCKHVLGLWEGATENHSVVRELLTSLIERGLSTEAPLLFVIDGAKALRKAIREVFGPQARIQRCRVHKLRNVLAHLPERRHALVRRALRAAFRTHDAARGRRLVENLARQLETDHPGAASSLREGLDELFTVVDLGVRGALRRTLESTNPIENLISTGRRLLRKVQRWRSGSMVLRWVATAVQQAEKGFRRVKGFRNLPALARALRRAPAPLARVG